MPMTATATPATPVVYPESDGLPMADNSRQFRWIVTIAGNLAGMFRDRPDVLVGGDMLWYPEEGNPTERVAPDVFVVFGRPKGERGSYRQWEEDGVPLTVVFEVLSPGNRPLEMAKKLAFYDEHGVEEYYVFDPDANELASYRRGRAALVLLKGAAGQVSPRLGIRFELSGPEMVIIRPDGRPFLTFEELEAERERQTHRADQAEQRADQAEQRADQAEQRAERMAALVRKVLQQQATAEEHAELQRLLQAAPPPGP